MTDAGGCFCLWAVVNAVGVNTGVQIPESLLSVLWREDLGAEPLDHMTILWFNFWKLQNHFLQLHL